MAAPTVNGSNCREDLIKRTRKRGFCRENLRLRQDILEAIRRVTQLQADQTRAVIEDDPDFARFDLLLHLALEKKDQSKYAWIAHVESHGCEET